MRITNQAQIPAYQTRRPLPAHNKRTVFYCCLWLSLAFILPELPSLLSMRYPSIKKDMADLFISKSYIYSTQYYWYIKDTCEDLKEIVLIIVVAKVSAKFSDFLFTASLIFLSYSIIDLGMYWWNNSTYVLAYWCLLWFVLVLIGGGISCYKPDKLAQIKSIF
jgi:hypothetical protein